MMGIFSVAVGSQRSRDSLNKSSYQKFKWCAHIRNFKRNLNTFLILALVQGRVIFNRCFRWSLEPVLTLLSTRSTIVTATLYPHTLAPIQGQYCENNAIKLFLWYLEKKHAMLWLLDVYATNKHSWVPDPHASWFLQSNKVIPGSWEVVPAPENTDADQLLPGLRAKICESWNRWGSRSLQCLVVTQTEREDHDHSFYKPTIQV